MKNAVSDNGENNLVLPGQRADQAKDTGFPGGVGRAHKARFHSALPPRLICTLGLVAKDPNSSRDL